MNSSIYDHAYRRAATDPEGFWAAAADDIVWERRWDRVLDYTQPPYARWFVGGRLNTCENALDVHVERVLTGVETPAHEPARIRRLRVVEHAVPAPLPDDVVRGGRPEPLGVGRGAAVGVVVDAAVHLDRLSTGASGSLRRCASPSPPRSCPLSCDRRTCARRTPARQDQATARAPRARSA